MVNTTTPHALVPVRLDAALGCASHNMTLPDSTQSIGSQFFAQWILRDHGVPGGLSASQGMHFTVF